MVGKGKYLLLALLLLLSFSAVPQTYATPSSATLKTWYYIDMSPEQTGYVMIGDVSPTKGAQGFKPFKDCSIIAVSLYICPQWSVTVELRADSPDGTLLAQGSAIEDVGGWWSIQFSEVSVSKDKWYYVVAWDPPPGRERRRNSLAWWYKNDGTDPNENEGNAYLYHTGQGWVLKSWDFLIRYRAKFTIDSTRVQQLKALADNYKPRYSVREGK